MTVLYATANDYQDWTQNTDAPVNIAALLRSASLQVADATVAAYYLVDDATSLPTDSTLVEALRDATTAQVAALVALDADPNLGGLDSKAPTRGKGIGSARIDYDTTAQSSAAALSARQAAVRTLCPDAVRILRTAGLLANHPWTWG